MSDDATARQWNECEWYQSMEYSMRILRSIVISRDSKMENMPYLRSHNETMIYHLALVTEKLAPMTMIMMSRYHYHYILSYSLRCVMSCRLTWIDITIYYIVIGPAHHTNLWDTSDIFRSKFDINNIHNLFVLFLASYLYTHTHTHIPINLVASSHIRVFSIQLCAWRQCRIYHTTMYFIFELI